MKLSNDEFVRIVDFVKSNFGIDLRKKKSLIEGRLINTLINRGYDNYSSYIDMVINDKSGLEVSKLIEILTTNHTYFMREKEHFDFLESKALPELEFLIKDKDIRIWCAGCSTGQEAYTLAMILDRYFFTKKSEWDKKLLATDISMNVLKKAIEGMYTKDEIVEIPQYFKDKYLEETTIGKYEVKKIIKNEVIFRLFNLMEPKFPFKKKFHVIFCRNVMIYFDNQTKNKLLKKFYDSLENGGYLFVGHSESVDRSIVPFQYIQPSVYRKVIR